jgi:sulfane dehydrogenase subunit SoxC
MTDKPINLPNRERAAGNGLLHRRNFLSGSLVFFSAASSSLISADTNAQSILPSSMQFPGAPLSGYGQRSQFESHVQRYVGAVRGTTGAGSSRTPLEKLSGTITPNGLHFERHHSGIPDINPQEHQLLIHGLVDNPLVFSIDALKRYPMVTRTHYIECSGNSRPNLSNEPANLSCGEIHGMISCSEWTGIPLSTLLNEVGVKPDARWVLAEGADASAMTRSIPLEKLMDDAILVLFQNGEALRPENGYPIRVLLPGYEGNISVKWLRRLKLSDIPLMTRDETAKYTDLQKNGKSEMFTLEMGVKSVITNPSGGQHLERNGLYEIKGLAWSGSGVISQVEVSADGGSTWAKAMLTEPVISKSLTQFRIPWEWSGQDAILMSRATDHNGNIQPDRATFIREQGLQINYHNNMIQSWHVSDSGVVRNTYV